MFSRVWELEGNEEARVPGEAAAARHASESDHNRHGEDKGRGGGQITPDN